MIFLVCICHQGIIIYNASFHSQRHPQLGPEVLRTQTFQVWILVLPLTNRVTSSKLLQLSCLLGWYRARSLSVILLSVFQELHPPTRAQGELYPRGPHTTNIFPQIPRQVSWIHLPKPTSTITSFWSLSLLCQGGCFWTTPLYTMYTPWFSILVFAGSDISTFWEKDNVPSVSESQPLNQCLADGSV